MPLLLAEQTLAVCVRYEKRCQDAGQTLSSNRQGTLNKLRNLSIHMPHILTNAHFSCELQVILNQMQPRLWILLTGRSRLKQAMNTMLCEYGTAAQRQDVKIVADFLRSTHNSGTGYEQQMTSLRVHSSHSERDAKNEDGVLIAALSEEVARLEHENKRLCRDKDDTIEALRTEVSCLRELFAKQQAQINALLQAQHRNILSHTVAALDVETAPENPSDRVNSHAYAR